MAAASSGCVASQVPFSDLCTVMEKIFTTSGTEKKRSLLRKFIEAWRTAHKKIHGDSKTVRMANFSSRNSLIYRLSNLFDVNLLQLT